MRNLKRCRRTAAPALTNLESQFALNALPLQCCHYPQLTDAARQQQPSYDLRLRALYRQIQPRQIITYCQQMLRTLRTVRVRRNLTAEARDMDMNEVNREELNARLGTIETLIDARFAEADAKEEARFAKAEAKSDVRFTKAEAKSDVRFAEADAKLERRFTELVKWMVVTAIAATAVGATILGLFLSHMTLNEPQAVAPVARNLVLTSPVRASPAMPRARPGYWSAHTARPRSASLPS
jgi:hypothetical protein